MSDVKIMHSRFVNIDNKDGLKQEGFLSLYIRTNNSLLLGINNRNRMNVRDFLSVIKEIEDINIFVEITENEIPFKKEDKITGLKVTRKKFGNDFTKAKSFYQKYITLFTKKYKQNDMFLYLG